jgi:hypothetical protein
MRKISRAQEQLSLFNFKTAVNVHDWNPARADIADHTIATPCADCGEVMGHPNHASIGDNEPFETARKSSKTAGAWPSNADWETHLKSLEVLLGEVQKGVGWHAAMKQTKEMKAHEKAGKAIQEAIDNTRRIMEFPDASKDK